MTACRCGGSGDTGSVTGPPTGPGPAPALPATLTGKVVFVRVQGTANTLMAMNPDGSGIVSLGVRGLSPHVSPDGRKVVYATAGEGIALLDLSTGREIELAPRLSVRPKWSPHGASIAFFGFHTSPNDPDLFSVSPNGGNVSVLLGGPEYDHGPSYGPRQ